jgi:acyl-CoA thioester hydrolase
MRDRPFVHRHRVRFHECDPQGRVFNARFLEYFDTAMVERLRAGLGSYLALGEEGYDYVVAEAQIRYLAPAHVDEMLEIEVQLIRPSRSSIQAHFRTSVAERAIATCEIRYVCLERGSGRTVEWPASVRALVPSGA